VLSTTVDRPLVHVRPHLLLAAFDRVPVMAPGPESQWRWEMCKCLVVEVMAKARKKPSVNGNYLGVGIPQRLNSTLNGLEATTEPTNR
jgi:hypothetical protein